jgi:hypothetical protein
MKKRTSVILDLGLVREAGEVLGTRQTTATIHEALREVVAREKRRRLAARDFPDLTPEAIEGMRRARTRIRG